MPIASGLLMYRIRERGVEVLLVHPGGPFLASKDDGAWTIPKGMPNDGEELLACARREFEEETGFDAVSNDDHFLPLGAVKQKGGKTVHAWAFAGDCDPSRLVSNTFKVQWPPKSGKWQTYPEVDRAAFFTLEQAKVKINAAQAELLARLAESLGKKDAR